MYTYITVTHNSTSVVESKCYTVSAESCMECQGLCKTKAVRGSRRDRHVAMQPADLPPHAVTLVTGDRCIADCSV